MSLHVVRRVVGPSILPRERLGFVGNNIPVLPEVRPSAGANSSSYGTWKHQTRAPENPQKTRFLRSSFCSCFPASLRCLAYANNLELSESATFRLHNNSASCSTFHVWILDKLCDHHSRPGRQPWLPCFHPIRSVGNNPSVISLII